MGAHLIRRARNALLRLRLRGRPLEQVFTYIYANNCWGHAETVSGHGSSLAKTASIRARLPDLLARYQVRSLVDVPCGDFHWLSTLDLSALDYTGGDIVRPLIRRNQQSFGGARKSFRYLDAASDAIPRADLILCRDLLIHLPLEIGLRVLRNFAASGSGLLLTTTYTRELENRDIPSGAWRPINLQRPPFGLAQPLELIEDGDLDPQLQDYGKCLGLWRLSDVGADLETQNVG